MICIDRPLVRRREGPHECHLGDTTMLQRDGQRWGLMCPLCSYNANTQGHIPNVSSFLRQPSLWGKRFLLPEKL